MLKVKIPYRDKIAELINTKSSAIPENIGFKRRIRNVVDRLAYSKTDQ